MRLRAPLSLLLLLGCVRAPAPVTSVSPSAPADAYLMRKGGPFDFAAAVEGPPDAGLVLDMAHPGRLGVGQPGTARSPVPGGR